MQQGKAANLKSKGFGQRVGMTSFKPSLESIQYEDLSGTISKTGDNPYDTLLDASGGCAREIQNRYHTHRVNRSAEQKEKMLASDFSGMMCDPILQKLYGDLLEPDYQDPRHCLVLWARPPDGIKSLIKIIQNKLLAVAPSSDIWLMPLDRLHMTVMEISHSRTAKEIADLIRSHFQVMSELANYTFKHRARLIKPLLSYDAQGLALSFLPGAGGILPHKRKIEEDVYTYHHLRRDIYGHLENAGVPIISRYIVPSAHLTVARFITSKDFTQEQASDQMVDENTMKQWIQNIEKINSWLQSDYWPSSEDMSIQTGGEWLVGQDIGLDLRQGTLWYGGGDTVKLGKGF